MDRRREHHIHRGDAARQPNGGVAYRRNLLATLREREVARVGDDLAATKGLPFRAAADGETVSGKFTGTVQLSSGKFALVEQSHEFTMVLSSTANSAARSAASFRADRCPGSLGGTGDGEFSFAADMPALIAVMRLSCCMFSGV